MDHSDDESDISFLQPRSSASHAKASCSDFGHLSKLSVGSSCSSETDFLIEMEQ